MRLELGEGLIWQGKSFGANKNVVGEVVFNTSMVGYVETLTDPSYRGQILVLTYPLQGNYGVPADFFESEQIQVQGLIVTHYTSNPSHFSAIQSLGDWLNTHNIPALCQVDTRTLTAYLRENGSAMGKLWVDETQVMPEVNNDLNHVLASVGQAAPVCYGAGDTKILFIDTGGKENIIRNLRARNVSVLRMPWNSNWEKHLSEVDGILLPNGPGDPMKAPPNLIERIRNLLTRDIPIFGICFGNQLIALATGGKTTKMKYGHRSVNQPVRDVTTGKCYITSQNHGYVVEQDSLPADWEQWFVNINDGTNEGIRHRHKPFFGVQFHPEACPGPNDTNFLFDDFIHVVKQAKQQRNAFSKENSDINLAKISVRE